MSATAKLAQAASDIALRAAVEWANVHGKQARAHERLDALVAALKGSVERALPGALEDARKAFEAGGMVNVRGGLVMVAEMTFKASMVLAGVEAAKEVLS